MANHALALPSTTDASTVMFINLSQCKTLTTTNYTQWAFQIQSFLEGLELFNYLDGSYKCPDKKRSPSMTKLPQIQPIRHGLGKTNCYSCR
ncbi:hypothetical protein vseg_011943 [Gypsophila vaccaria]